MKDCSVASVISNQFGITLLREKLSSNVCLKSGGGGSNGQQNLETNSKIWKYISPNTLRCRKIF